MHFSQYCFIFRFLGFLKNIILETKLNSNLYASLQLIKFSLILDERRKIMRKSSELYITDLPNLKGLLCNYIFSAFLVSKFFLL